MTEKTDWILVHSGTEAIRIRKSSIFLYRTATNNEGGNTLLHTSDTKLLHVDETVQELDVLLSDDDSTVWSGPKL